MITTHSGGYMHTSLHDMHADVVHAVVWELENWLYCYTVPNSLWDIAFVQVPAYLTFPDDSAAEDSVMCNKSLEQFTGPLI